MSQGAPARSIYVLAPCIPWENVLRLMRVSSAASLRSRREEPALADLTLLFHAPVKRSRRAASRFFRFSARLCFLASRQAETDDLIFFIARSCVAV